MTHRNTSPQILQATPTSVPVALRAQVLASLVLVLVLITVVTGAGVGFA